MNAADVERFTGVLIAKQRELSGSMGTRDEIIIERVADSLDAVQLMGERELAVGNLARYSNALRQIRNALDRVAHDTYGMCMNCEEDISSKRLTAVPWAAFCIKCQEKIDRREIEIDESLGCMPSLPNEFARIDRELAPLELVRPSYDFHSNAKKSRRAICLVGTMGTPGTRP